MLFSWERTLRTRCRRYSSFRTSSVLKTYHLTANLAPETSPRDHSFFVLGGKVIHVAKTCEAVTLRHCRCADFTGHTEQEGSRVFLEVKRFGAGYLVRLRLFAGSTNVQIRCSIFESTATEVLRKQPLPPRLASIPSELFHASDRVVPVLILRILCCFQPPSLLPVDRSRSCLRVTNCSPT